MRYFFCIFFLLSSPTIFVYGQDPQPAINLSTVTLQGSVKDPIDVALPGVSVVVEGTTQGTTTDANGH